MAFSDYVKQVWADLDPTKPASAARMGVIEDGIFNAHYQPAVAVFHNAAQSITSATATALAFNSERYDQAANAADTMHDTVTNNSRLTCRYAGVYSIIGNIEWASVPTNAALISIRLNGATLIARQNYNVDSRVMQVMRHYSLAVNDYVELVVQQNSGGAINVNSTANYSPEFSMVRVG